MEGFMNIKKPVGFIVLILSVLIIFIDLSFFNIFKDKLKSLFDNISSTNYFLSCTLFLFGLFLIFPYRLLLNKIRLLFDLIKSLPVLKQRKIFISLFFFLIFMIYLINNNLKIDTIGLALSIMVSLPWLAAIIRSAKLPGGIEVVFSDIKEAQKLVENLPANLRINKHKYSFLNILGVEPNIAMAALRIEMETRLREIGKFYNFSEYEPLTSLFRSLRKKKALTEQELFGIEELIYVGNKAAHGAKIDNQVIKWATDYGPIVLTVLDNKLKDIRKKKDV